MPISPRERRFAAMRVISEWVDANRREERKLLPRWDRIAVGSADFEFLLKATVGEAYLRVLRAGGTPDEARAEAARDGSECVRKWNANGSRMRACVHGSYELERWSGAGESEADNLHRTFLSMVR